MPNDVLIPAAGTASVVTHVVKIDGSEIPRTFSIATMAISKEINRIPRARLILLDGDAASGDFPASNGELFVPGKEIEILVGFESENELVFKGIIVKQKIKINANGQSMLRLECLDPAFKTTLGRKNRYFQELTDADAIEEILGEYGLDTDIEAIDVTHKELVQFEASDWDFLVSRAEANGRLCFVSDGSLAIKKPDTSTEPVLTLTYGSTLLDFEAEIDARKQFASVKSYSWDHASQELQETEAADPELDEGGNISGEDLSEVGELASFDLRHSGNLLPEELQAWADAYLLRSRLAKVRGRAKFQGFAGIKPGDMVELQAVGDRFNGKAFVSAIRHDIAEGSWTTSAQLGLSDQWHTAQYPFHALPASSLLPAIQGLQIGIVSQVGEDPDGEHRILVKIPVISTEEEGIWARIATLDAGSGDGAGRGTFFLPEIDDEVIVGFINGDPRDPVVLGMLHSSANPAPLEASDDNHEKGYVSRSDMKLLFNDDTVSLSLETPAGKKILLDEDEGVLQMEDEHGNKIIMNSDGITIESGGELILKSATDLKAEAGTNLELTAGAEFKAEGGAGAALTTGAIAKIEGSLVQIN